MTAQSMKVLTLASQKGGAGKSSLAIHLAVEATRTCTKGGALLVDADPQASAFDWARNRAELRPLVVRCGPDDLHEVVQQAQDEGFEMCIIDTPPHAGHSIDRAIRLSDLVLIPVCNGRLNWQATAATADMLEIAGRRGAFVLNRTPSRAAGSEEAQVMLHERHPQLPVLAARIGHRVAFERAVDAGLGVREFCRPRDKARLEMAALHDEILGLL